MSPKHVPDGGWGWTVVVGTAVINVFNQSLLSVFGLIFGTKLQHIAGTTGVTTVMSINCTISNFSGLLISPLSKYLNARQMTQIGVVLVAAGLALSAYTKSYARIVFGYGILTGLGLGLIASSSFLIINSYFDKNKSQAVGLAMAGTSIGQMGMPPAIALLVEHYGYDGTILILCGLSLHGLIGAMFFDPVEKHMVLKSKPVKSCYTQFRNWICCSKNSDIKEVNSSRIDLRVEGKLTNIENNTESLNINKTDSTIIINKCDIGSGSDIDNKKHKEDESGSTLQNNLQIKPAKASRSPISDSDSTVTEEREKMLPEESRVDVDETESDENDSRPKSFWQKLVELFDLHILLDPTFVHIMIGLSLAYTTSVAFSTFFPLFLTADLDMSIIEASTCMTTLSLVDFLGRIIVPLVTRHVGTTHRTTFIVGLLILAMCRSILALQTSYFMVLALSAICGLTRAATIINQNLVIAEYSAEAHISSAVGLNMVSKGIFILSIGRLLGMYKDSAHLYSSCIHILDIIATTVVVCWTTEILIKKVFIRPYSTLSKSS